MEMLSSKTVITRKPHNCWGCMREYPVNTKMERFTSVDGGSISTVYYCEGCVSIFDALPVGLWNDGWFYGELMEYYNDYILPNKE